MPDINDINQGIEVLDIPLRTYNVLKRSGINTIAELLTLSRERLFTLRGMLPEHVDPLLSVIAEHGLSTQGS